MPDPRRPPGGYWRWIVVLILLLAGPAAAELRIVGGRPAAPGSWPWTAALVKPGRPADTSVFCGGSLIHPQWVLTAAHCLLESLATPVRPNTLEVVVGRTDLAGTGGQRIPVRRIIVHPRYNESVLDDNDVGLIELAYPATAPTIAPYQGPADLAGQSGWVVGWGDTDDIPRKPKTLMEAEVPIVSNAACNAAYNQSPFYDAPITDQMVCAGRIGGGADACTGDSGGPLMVLVDGQWQVAGVVSWGEGCGAPGYFGVYARVSALMDFIGTHLPLDSPVYRCWFPVIANGARWETGVGVLNTGEEPVTAMAQGLDAGGKEIPEAVWRETLPPGAHWTLAPGAPPAGTEVRALRIEADRPALAGYAVFRDRASGEQAAVPVAPPATDRLVLPHIAATDLWRTGLGLLNTGAETRTLRLQAPGHPPIPIVLGPQERRTFWIRDLFGGIPRPDLRRAVVENAAGVAGILLHTSSPESGNRHLSGIALREPTAVERVIPHITGGTHWWTGLALSHDAPFPVTLRLAPYGPGGRPLPTREVPINAGQTWSGTATGLALPAGTEWLRVTGRWPVAAFTAFGRTDGIGMGGLVPDTAGRRRGWLLVPLPATSVDWTGIALVNAESRSAAVRFSARDAAGAERGATWRDIGPRQRWRGTLAQLFPDLPAGEIRALAFDATEPLHGLSITASGNDEAVVALPAFSGN